MPRSSRRDSAVRHRLREARFPETKTLDAFDFTATDGSINAAQITELARGEWIARGDNMIFAGPIGAGKTHLAIALGVEATRQRRRVLFARAADLVRTLLEARDARELGRLQRRLQHVDLLVLDELGFVPFDRAGGELLFNLVRELVALFGDGEQAREILDVLSTRAPTRGSSSCSRRPTRIRNTRRR